MKAPDEYILMELFVSSLKKSWVSCKWVKPKGVTIQMKALMY